MSTQTVLAWLAGIGGLFTILRFLVAIPHFLETRKQTKLKEKEHEEEQDGDE